MKDIRLSVSATNEILSDVFGKKSVDSGLHEKGHIDAKSTAEFETHLNSLKTNGTP